MKKKIILLIILFLLTGCTEHTTGYIGVKRNDENNNMYLDINVNLFNELFSYGDSLKITLANGTEIKNIPYYSGYYTKFNELLFIQNGNNIELACYGKNNTWTNYSFKNSNYVEVELDVEGMYLSNENTFKFNLSNNVDDFSSEEAFTNFRALTGGKIRNNYLYRSASPINTELNRSEILNKQILNNKIKYIINIDNDSTETKTLNTNCTSYNTLYKNKKVYSIKLDNNYQTEDAAKNISKIMDIIINNNGPFLIHSYDGVNRLGFLSVLLEALSGASYDEMLNDYMESYKNYYNITKETDYTKYYIIVQTRFDDFLYYLSGTTTQKEIKEADFKVYAMQYLKLGGMKYKDINKVIDKISN